MTKVKRLTENVQYLADYQYCVSHSAHYRC